MNPNMPLTRIAFPKIPRRICDKVILSLKQDAALKYILIHYGETGWPLVFRMHVAVDLCGQVVQTQTVVSMSIRCDKHAWPQNLRTVVLKKIMTLGGLTTNEMFIPGRKGEKLTI